MKKVLTALVIASALAVTVADAASIGRGGGGFSGGRSSSSSVSRPSSPSPSHSSTVSTPSKPAVAPAPSQTGGIGGNTASVGVRKSEVTNGVRQDIAATKPAPTSVGSSGSSGSYTPHYTPTPSYGYSAPPQPTVTNGSTFMSSLGGSFLGSWMGSSIANSGNRGGGTTVVNTGGSGGVGPQSVVNSDGTVVSNGTVYTQPKKEYTVWSFIADLIGFVFVVAILLGIAWVFYKGFQLVRDYVNKERGVSNQPFNPTQRFWEIQKAFAAADVTILQKLLGPDVVDELTANLLPSTLTLSKVSHEVRLHNASEFSVWYSFTDNDETVNQVWHYEKFPGPVWKLNGIENV